MIECKDQYMGVFEYPLTPFRDPLKDPYKDPYKDLKDPFKDPLYQWTESYRGL